jgi:zinc transporter ZupT
MSLNAVDTMAALPSAKPLAPAVKTSWLAPAAGGALLGAALFHVMPAALASIGVQALAWGAAGFLVMVMAGVASAGRKQAAVAVIATLGIWMHSLLEGMTAATGFSAGWIAGGIVSAGLVVHLIPEGAALMALLTGTGMSLRKASWRFAVTVGLVVAGFLASEFMLPGLATAPLSRATAFGGGVLAYLAYMSWRQRSEPTAYDGAIAIMGCLLMAVLSLAS